MNGASPVISSASSLAGPVTLNGGGLQWAPGVTTDISSKLNPLGPNGGVFDTNGNNITLGTLISGSGPLTKVGAGTLTVGYIFGAMTVSGGVLQIENAIPGNIVNNASVLGWRAQAGQAHYAAAKAGVMALTRCAAVEAAAANVRVNAVSPSLAMHAHLAKVTTESLLADLTKREAFGRAAEPWEVANVIIFLASDLASYMTGEVVSVSSQHP